MVRNVVQCVSATHFLLLLSFSSYAAGLILPDPKIVHETEPHRPREIRRAPSPPEPNKFVTYCTDVVFPNDIVCDMTEFKRDDRWLQLQPIDFTGLQFGYKVSSRMFDKCYIVYKPKDPRKLDRFVYAGVKCIFPKGDVALPKGKKTSDFKEVDIVANKPDNESYQCTFSSVAVGKFRGEITERGRRFNSRLVKYRLKNNGCVLPISIGREPITQTPCVKDSRGRCRPRRS